MKRYGPAVLALALWTVDSSAASLPTMDPAGQELFERYQRSADPIARKIGNATAIEQCGLREKGWYPRVTEPLERRLLELKQGLHTADLPYARRFDRETAASQTRFALSGNVPTRAGCRLLAAMPFIHADGAFRP